MKKADIKQKSAEADFSLDIKTLEFVKEEPLVLDQQQFFLKNELPDFECKHESDIKEDIEALREQESTDEEFLSHSEEESMGSSQNNVISNCGKETTLFSNGKHPSRLQIAELLNLTEEYPNSVNAGLHKPNKDYNEFWHMVSTTLNNMGPCVKSSEKWKTWFNGYKFQAQRKLSNGMKISELEEKAISLNCSKRLNQAQIATLLKLTEEYPNFVNAGLQKPNKDYDEFWHMVSKTLNDMGPSVKSTEKWRFWFNQYKYKASRKLSNGMKTSELEEKAVSFKCIRPSNQQILTLLNFTKENSEFENMELKNKRLNEEFWLKVTKKLNEMGPCIKSCNKWRMWVNSYRSSARKKISNGNKITPLEEKAANSKETRPSDEQLDTLLNFIEKNPNFDNYVKPSYLKERDKFWSKISKVLNAMGPCIRGDNLWRIRFNSFKSCARKKVSNGRKTTSFERRAIAVTRK